MSTSVSRLELGSSSAATRKPRALRAGSVWVPFAPASPVDFAKVNTGAEELRQLGFEVADATPLTPEDFFAGPVAARRNEFLCDVERDDVDALVAVRGGYGANYILEDLQVRDPERPRVILGYSDLTSLQIFLWQRYQWTAFYGPMLAAGLDAGAGVPRGYDKESLLAAVGKVDAGWKLPLSGETFVPGEAEGRILGGCMTLVETTLGTPWELDTGGAILLLEDRGMKPWQIDRALMHLKQAGKFDGVNGFIVGDFPECEAPMAGSPSVRDVCLRILAPLGVPIVFGVPVGHTLRPMLTVPLGVRARLRASGEGELQILEPAVVDLES
jgi:muramoyltetrapeptide carboxypeptidase